MKTHLFITVLLTINLFAQDNDVLENDIKLPNDVRWVTESNEYNKLCMQIYRSAWRIIRNVYAEDRVIIMDLDETVLDNSQYQIDLFLNSQSFNLESWNNFVRKEISTLVPGAKEFIRSYKSNKNSKIIFLSNRSVETSKATKNNMKALGIYYKNDIFLLKENENDSKVARRLEVFEGTGRMKKHGPLSVIAYFGDAIGDFPDDKNYEFGINKFIFPNPMYGKW
ncbi:hypothetical protein OAJ42_00170 [Flavobacteriales bacterium]|nr:hypothetical protein [Flavobacteriales bacterium]